MPEPNDLLAYLRQHGGRYDDEVLCEHLVSQGQDRVAVDAAVEAYRAERQARGRNAGKTFLWTIGTTLLGLASLGVLIVGGCFGGFVLMMSESPTQKASAYEVVAGIVAVFLLLVFSFFAALRRARNKAREENSSRGDRS
jgi:uncharacterized BrkB/YihY/UPF0761 family membrane protein